MSRIPLSFMIIFTINFAGCVPNVLNSIPSKTSLNSPPSGEDPLASESWHLENTGQKSFSSGGGVAGEDFKIKQAHALGLRGKGISIAVSDTGTDINHPDLKGNELFLLHRDYSKADPFKWHGGNPYPVEGEGHGTAVTGLIAALASNGIGSRGVAPEAKFASFLFVGDFYTSDSSEEAKTVDQMQGNFDIFNFSYGYPGCQFVDTTDSIIDSYYSGVKNLRNGKGAIYVKAAGNDYVGLNRDCLNDNTNYAGNTNTNEDQNVPYLILTAAMNARGKISSYSTPGSGLWISSAGGEFSDTGPAMVTTDIQGCDKGISSSLSPVPGFNKGNSANPLCDYTSLMNGTSSAAPVLTGIIALMLEANPDLTWRDVKHILATTADKVNFTTAELVHPLERLYKLSNHVYDNWWITNAANYSFSNTYGFGRANAYAAVSMAKIYNFPLGEYSETINPNSQEWYYNSSVLNLPIPDHSAVGVENTLTVHHNYVIESVQIKVTTDHTLVGDLGIELTSPSGTTSKILLIKSNIKQNSLSDYLLLTNAFYGEKSTGSWKLKVIDGATGSTGQLISWRLKINGSVVKSEVDTIPPAAPTNISMVASSNSLSESPDVSFTPSISSDIQRYEVAVSTSPNTEDKALWYSIGNTTTFKVTGLVLETGITYYVKIRSIDISENISSEVISTWTTN